MPRNTIPIHTFNNILPNRILKSFVIEKNNSSPDCRDTENSTEASYRSGGNEGVGGKAIVTGARQKTRGAHKRQRAGIITCQGCMHDNTKRDSPSSSLSTDPSTRFSRSVLRLCPVWRPKGGVPWVRPKHRRGTTAAFTMPR